MIWVGFVLTGYAVGFAKFLFWGDLEILPDIYDAAMAMAMVVVDSMGFDTRWVEGMPTALMKPLSGGGARAMAIEAMETHGVDSFVGRLSCVFQGSTETTFYTLAVYFGAVNIRKTRHTVACGLIADCAGIATAILVAYLFFGSMG